MLMPSSRSLHQDHQVIYIEGMRAFKRHTCLGYDLPWDTHEFPTTAFQVLDEHHVETKIAALQMYKTQAHRGYVSPVFTLLTCSGSGESRFTVNGRKCSRYYEYFFYSLTHYKSKFRSQPSVHLASMRGIRNPAGSGRSGSGLVRQWNFDPEITRYFTSRWPVEHGGAKEMV